MTFTLAPAPSSTPCPHCGGGVIVTPAEPADKSFVAHVTPTPDGRWDVRTDTHYLSYSGWGLRNAFGDNRGVFPTNAVAIDTLAKATNPPPATGLRFGAEVVKCENGMWDVWTPKKYLATDLCWRMRETGDDLRGTWPTRNIALAALAEAPDPDERKA